ncbi:MAG: phytanoyl-CoA dioxygenase [Rhodospirillaceae bacterium]|nr:phytanoyl-CoA dioxygenase [Rhodospirillaceae bacterium]|tara:strand:+ start:784 stop:1647 length:864 start_codon:yes stop_codon:yes gene_type:complete
MARDHASDFERDGVLVGVDILNSDEAATYLASIERFERDRADDLPVQEIFRTGAHMVLSAVDELVRHPSVLDCIEALLGPDLMVWDSDILIKEPHSEGYISWHQDLRYWGVDSTYALTAWIALTDATREMGCMRFLPGSHHEGLLDHTDTFEGRNMLSRGQTAAFEVDEAATTSGDLRAGQMSVHHSLMLHASTPNRSDRRRVGLAIRYATPALRQIVADRDYAQLVRGEDRHGNFLPAPRPDFGASPDAVAAWRRITDDQAAAYFQGVDEDKKTWTGGDATRSPAS